MSALSTERSDLVERAASLVQRGDLNAAIPQYVRLFQSDPGDWNVANTLGDLYVRAGRADAAVEHFIAVAERLATDGFTAKARALYRKILRIQPNQPVAKQRVDELDKQGGSASPFLQRVLETARTARESRPAPPPDVEEPPSHVEEPARAIDVPAPNPPLPHASSSAEAAAVEPEPVAIRVRIQDHHPPAPPIAVPTPPPIALEPEVADEFAAPEAAAKNALRHHDFAAAYAAVEQFLVGHPRHIRALEKLIDIGVDGRLDAELPWAQVRLAEACLEAGRYEQAQDVAIDLIFREPGSTRHQELLDRVTTAARERRVALRPAPVFDLQPPEQAAVPPEAPPPSPEIAMPPPAQPLAQFHAPADAADAEPESECELPQDLREWSDPVSAFDDIRTMLLEEAAAAAEDRLAEAERLIEARQFDQAARALEEAMCAPHLRTPAGARLAGMYRDVGAPIEALACLEWVAEMPPASEESGHDLAYQLALTLEALGQQAQALGVYRELLAEVGPAYRDVATRAERLAAA